MAQGLGPCKYTTSGEKIDLTREQIDILQYMRANARSSIKQIAEKSGYSYKHVRRVIEQFAAGNAVHLTLALNLTSSGQINLILKSRLSDMTVDPNEVANWVACRYPEEHWFSFFTPQTDNVIHYMTVKHPAEIERMANEVISHTQIDEIEAAIIYSALKSEGRTKCFLESHAASDVGIAQEATVSMIRQTGQVSLTRAENGETTIFGEADRKYPWE
jgi:DNA-binding Lrp family transcriptional regulator